MDESTGKWVKLEVLDWKSGWTQSYRLERVQGDFFRKIKEVFDQDRALITSKAKEFELDVTDSDYLMHWEFFVYLKGKTRKKFVSYTLEGDEESVEFFRDKASWSVKRGLRTPEVSPEYQYRPEVNSELSDLDFDSNPKITWKVNGTEYLALKVFDGESHVMETLFSVDQIQSATSECAFALTRTGGSWKDWKFSVYRHASLEGKPLGCFVMDGTQIYFELLGNAAEASANAFRYQLEALFRELWHRGVQYIPTNGWARWIVEQYLIHDLGDFNMLDDSFKFELNMTEDELQEFRTQMFEPWKFPKNNTQYRITGEYKVSKPV
ncbi:MAG: hypothetical protein EBU08_10755 [Micrococcales bacterium]|nr:hypothetical protein [Micrococcales bacterium]